LRSTLFYIPAELAGFPVFGLGWLLGAWIVFSVILLAWTSRRPDGSREIAGYLPILIVVAAVIAFLLPNMVELGPMGRPLGVPIRGFGVMLMLATIAAVGLAAYRAWQAGLDPDVIYSLAFVMFIAGIIGARLFYIVEYWTQFARYTPRNTLDLAATIQASLNVTKGGLVVYGSVLAGVPAGIWFCLRRGLPVLAIGDIIAPSMVVGLALGRIGCFLNGCCFGGVCLSTSYAVTFPAGSPPYLQQEASGWQSGVWLTAKDNSVVVAYVASQSAAAIQGLKPGDKIISINGAKVGSLIDAREKLAAGSTSFEVETADGRLVRWLNPQPPPRSVPVHPTQLYSAIDAALLALVLWLYYPFRRRDGEVFAILVTIHPISRFLLEMIRSDEPGQFGTPLTISQWLSLAILTGACMLWWYVERHPIGRRVQGSGFRTQDVGPPHSEP
jgi:phosphatidylglycerol---prolipoprotein diacylglyceryl transferase